MTYEITSPTNLHTEILPLLKVGDTLTKTYTNKYGDTKVMTFDFTLNEYNKPVLTGRRKFKYEMDYITYEFYNNYSNCFEGYKLVSSLFVR